MKDYSNSHSFCMPVPDDYKHLWAYHRASGSMDYYIDALLKKAREDKAPLDAVYFDDREGKWHTFGEMENPALQDEIIKRIKEGQ